MKKYDLLKSGDSIVRVLEIRQDKVLIIDCIKRTMPVWTETAVLEPYTKCSDGEFAAADIDELSSDQRKIMQERYTIIAPILPFIADDTMRSQVIQSVATEYGVSKQTVRRYLCLYLAYMDISALAPKEKSTDTELTLDEKNIRWALNKYFYTRNKNSLMTAYTMMLKEKYCNGTGELKENDPSFYQFRYFYRKTRKIQNYYISRDGLTHYQRNNRPLTGEGVQEFAPAVGTGMLDATVCDIYLVDDTGNLVGRPILTACIDAYSGLCCGYSLSWEGGVYSLRGLIHDAQEIAILDGSEILNIDMLNEAYQKRLTLLHDYIEPAIKRNMQCSTTKSHRKVSATIPAVRLETNEDISISDLVNTARSENIDIVEVLKQHIAVVEVAI